MAVENPREIRGVEIAAKGNEISRSNESCYRVRSQSNPGTWYLVVRNGYKEWSCECANHVNRGVTCKHIYGVHYSLKLRQRVTERNLNLGIEIAVNDTSCPKCRSPETVRDGQRRNKHGNAQRYLCKVCDYRFIPDTAFTKIKATPQAVMASLDLYFKGCSLNDIKDHLRQFYKVKVTHPAIIKWIRKYTTLMTDYTDAMTPNASTIWHTDEMMVHVRKTEPIAKERYSWLWNLMDSDTRFLLANQIHENARSRTPEKCSERRRPGPRTCPSHSFTTAFTHTTRRSEKSSTR